MAKNKDNQAPGSTDEQDYHLNLDTGDLEEAGADEAPAKDEAEIEVNSRTGMVYFHIPIDITPAEIKTLLGAIGDLHQRIGPKASTKLLEYPRRFGKASASDLMSSVRQGGFTYNPITDRSPTEGFVVSKYPEHEKIHDFDQMSEQDVQAYLDEKKDFVNNTPNAHVGAWYNSKNGKVYLDVTHLAKDHAEARKLALEHKQEAYYDISEGQTHYVFAHDGTPPTPGTKIPHYIYQANTQTWTEDPNDPPTKEAAAGTYGLRKMKVFSFMDVIKFLKANQLDLDQPDVQTFGKAVKTGMDEHSGAAFDVDVIALATDQFKLVFTADGEPLIETEVKSNQGVTGLNGSRYRRQPSATNRVYGTRDYRRSASAEMQKADIPDGTKINLSGREWTVTQNAGLNNVPYTLTSGKKVCKGIRNKNNPDIIIVLDVGQRQVGVFSETTLRPLAALKSASAEMQKAGWGFKLTGESMDDADEAAKIIRANLVDDSKTSQMVYQFRGQIRRYTAAKQGGDTEVQPPQLEMSTTNDQAGQSVERMLVLNVWKDGEYTTFSSARIGGQPNTRPAVATPEDAQNGYRRSGIIRRTQGATMFKVSSLEDIQKALSPFSRANETPVSVDGQRYYAGVHKNPKTQRWTAMVKEGGRTGPIIGESLPMRFRSQAVEFIKTTILTKAQTVLPLRGVQASPRNFLAKERQSAEKQISAYLGRPVTIEKVTIQLDGKAIGTLTSKSGVAVAIFDDAVTSGKIDQPDYPADMPAAPDREPEEFYYAAISPMRKKDMRPYSNGRLNARNIWMQSDDPNKFRDDPDALVSAVFEYYEGGYGIDAKVFKPGEKEEIERGVREYWKDHREDKEIGKVADGAITTRDGLLKAVDADYFVRDLNLEDLLSHSEAALAAQGWFEIKPVAKGLDVVAHTAEGAEYTYALAFPTPEIEKAYHSQINKAVGEWQAMNGTGTDANTAGMQTKITLADGAHPTLYGVVHGGRAGNNQTVSWLAEIQQGVPPSKVIAQAPQQFNTKEDAQAWITEWANENDTDKMMKGILQDVGNAVSRAANGVAARVSGEKAAFWINSKAGKCGKCGGQIEAGSLTYEDKQKHITYCEKCIDQMFGQGKSASIKAKMGGKNDRGQTQAPSQQTDGERARQFLQEYEQRRDGRQNSLRQAVANYGKVAKVYEPDDEPDVLNMLLTAAYDKDVDKVKAAAAILEQRGTPAIARLVLAMADGGRWKDMLAYVKNARRGNPAMTLNVGTGEIKPAKKMAKGMADAALAEAGQYPPHSSESEWSQLKRQYLKMPEEELQALVTTLSALSSKLQDLEDSTRDTPIHSKVIDAEHNIAVYEGVAETAANARGLLEGFDDEEPDYANSDMDLSAAAPMTKRDDQVLLDKVKAFADKWNAKHIIPVNTPLLRPIYAAIKRNDLSRAGAYLHAATYDTNSNIVPEEMAREAETLVAEIGYDARAGGIVNSEKFAKAKDTPAPKLDKRPADDVRPISDVTVDIDEWVKANDDREPQPMQRGQWTFLVGAKRETAEVIDYTGTYAAAAETAQAYASAKGEKKITLAVSTGKMAKGDAFTLINGTYWEPQADGSFLRDEEDDEEEFGTIRREYRVTPAGDGFKVTLDKIYQGSYSDQSEHTEKGGFKTAKDAISWIDDYNANSNSRPYTKPAAKMSKADAGLETAVADLKAAIKEAEAYTGPKRPMLPGALNNAKGTLSGIDNPPAGRRNTLTAKEIERVTWNLRNAMRNAV